MDEAKIAGAQKGAVAGVASPCVERRRGLLRVVPVALADGLAGDPAPEGMNHHPSFACDESEAAGACNAGVALDDEQVPGSIVLRLPKKLAEGQERTFLWEAWDPAEELPWDNCAEAPESLPRVHAGDAEYEVFLRFDASDRETVRAHDPGQ